MEYIMTSVLVTSVCVCVCVCVCDESRGFVRVMKAKIRETSNTQTVLTRNPLAQHKLSKSRTQ